MLVIGTCIVVTKAEVLIPEMLKVWYDVFVPVEIRDHVLHNKFVLGIQIYGAMLAILPKNQCSSKSANDGKAAHKKVMLHSCFEEPRLSTNYCAVGLPSTASAGDLKIAILFEGEETGNLISSALLSGL